MDSFDLVIIGAGIYGLITAKTYFEINPGASIAIFDNGKTIGGVWSKERLYPGLKTQHQYGTFEFSDFPMPSYGLTADDFIPGTMFHDYLVAFSDHFDLTKHIVLETWVTTADSQGQAGWKLSVKNPQGEKDVLARSLVVATGLTSVPMMPKIPGMETFGKPLLHTKEWSTRASELENSRDVTILGSSKAAMDAAHYYAAKGANVNWIIRRSGHGACWIWPSHLTPLKIRPPKVVPTRAAASLGPCIWAEEGWWRRFLGYTSLGQWLTMYLQKAGQDGVLRDTGVGSDPETAKLLPSTDMMWHGCHIATLNYENDFIDMVRTGKVKVHVADIDRLEPDTVVLSDGSRLTADAFFCATGWKFMPPIKFTGISEFDLGLPQASASGEKLKSDVDKVIFERYPLLNRAPKPSPRPLEGIVPTPEEPYRLFRFTTPPRLAPMHNLAYAGALFSVTGCLTAQLQALWIAVFLSGKLETAARPVEELEYETYLHTQFCKHRAPVGFSSRVADFATDSIPFLDLLLKDLGLKVYRKSNSFAEFFSAYGTEDYKDLAGEWLAKEKLAGR